MTKSKYIIVFIALMVVGLNSCDKIFLDEISNNPVSNFEYLWHDFDKLYGLFIVKNINWDSLYAVYRPEIDDNCSEKDLYDNLCGLLENLNDGHVYLSPTNLELSKFHSGKISRMGSKKDFKYSIVKDNYLIEEKTYSDIIHYGKLADNIGYIHVRDMSNGQNHYEKAMKTILDYLKETKAIIFDVRLNGGGWDRTTKTIAGRFFTQKTLFLIAKKRNGPEHNDFCEPIYYYIEPYGDFQYTKPMVLLTHRESSSAAESFVLGMKRRENLIHIGDTTEGAFSDAITRELPNGWLYGLSIGDYRDYNSVNWEGIGIPPDIVIQNDSTDVKNGIDKALETAINYLN